MASSKNSQRPWRKIIRRDTEWSEKLFTGKGAVSWSATYRHTLTLECGHKQVRRGFKDPPKKEVVCKDCEEGQARVSTVGVHHGVFDQTKETRGTG